MSLRRPFTVTVLALLVSGVLGASATAGVGGAGPGELVLPGTPPVVVQIGNPVTSASGNGVSIAVRSTAILRGVAHVRGTAPAHTPAVRIERLDPLLGWVAVASAPVAPGGGFDAVWKPDHVGATQLRAVAGSAPAGMAGSSADTTATPDVAVAVYRRGVASWYGPGTYGVTTACGVVLRHATLGVAHRTLPCGTPIALYYRGRTVVVPVIDRGPYVHGRSWDLTMATFHALGGTRANGLLKLGALPAGPAPAGSRTVQPGTPAPTATTTPVS
jgi:hypothetical protein